MGRTADVVLHVPMVFTSLLFENDESLDFSSIQASLRHLETWLDVRKLTQMSHGELTRDGNDPIAGYSSIAVNHPSVNSISLLGGELLLLFNYEIAGDEYTSMTLSQRAAVKFVPASNTELSDLFETIGPIQQMLTIASDSPSVYTDIRFEHHELTKFREEDPYLEDHVKLYTRVRGSGLGGDNTSVSPDKMLFTYEDIGGIEGLAKWIELAQKYRVVLEPLLGHKYLPVSFVGNRLSDAAGAADAFYLIRYGAEPGAVTTLRKRLVALAERAGPTFCSVVRDSEDWATHVKNARTEIVHAGERDDQQYDDQAYGTLARSVYLVLVLCFLRELEVSEEVITRAIATRFRTLGARLHAAIGDEPLEDQQEADLGR